MNTHLTVRVAPMEDAAPPDGEIIARDTDPDGGIPVLTITREHHSFAAVEVHLGNNPDPAAWLRSLAAAAVDLAEQVEAIAIDRAEAVTA